MIRPDVLMFDLDGTLVDSLADLATSINLARTELGLAPLPPRDVIAQVGDGVDALVRKVIPVAPERHAAALAAFLRIYELHMLDTTQLMPGVRAMLERYADRALVVVTNKRQHISEHILEGLGVRNNFRMVVGGDTLPVRKPDPGPLHHVLATLGVRPAQAVMIGDGVNDVLAARSAGVTMVAVLGGVTSQDDLAALGPDHLIGGLDRLPEVIG
jgi:phosphoglycolate phosphatase